MSTYYFDKDKDKNLLLSFFLWSKYVEAKDKPSCFYVVIEDGYETAGFRKGHVYMNLGLCSFIHPLAYVPMTWGEAYRWLGNFEWELGDSNTESACIKDNCRTIGEIVADGKKKNAEEYIILLKEMFPDIDIKEYIKQHYPENFQDIFCNKSNNTTL